MGLWAVFQPKKTLSELEEEREVGEAEISVLQQRVLKKELEKRGAELSSFKGNDGKPVWSRVINWVKSH
jgi:hypothetical protein